MRPIRTTIALVSLAAMTGSLFSGVQPASAVFPGANGKIVFASDRDGNDKIYTMAANGRHLTRLTFNATSDYNPQWSPDRQSIVFESKRSGNDEIYVMDHAGLEPHQAHQERRIRSDAGVLTRRHRRRLREQPRRQRQHLRRERDRSKHPVTRLTVSDEEDWMPAWSPDGSEIAFASHRDGDFESTA